MFSVSTTRIYGCSSHPASSRSAIVSGNGRIALNRTIRQIDRGLALAIDARHVGAFDTSTGSPRLSPAPRRGVVHGGVTVGVGCVHVGVQSTRYVTAASMPPGDTMRALLAYPAP